MPHPKYIPLQILKAPNGAQIKAHKGDRDLPAHLSLCDGSGQVYGFIDNTPETRRWFEDTLRMFRRDASRLRTRAKKKDPQWYKAAADSHAIGDSNCGRSWQCACGACRAARKDGYVPNAKG